MNIITNGIQNINMESYSLEDLLNGIDLNKDEIICENEPLSEDNINISHIIHNIFHNNFDIFNNENNIRFMGISNEYCAKYFDDEDFLYRKITLPKKIQKILTGNQSLNKYVLDMIIQSGIILNYSQIQSELHFILIKIAYIFQFSEYYYNVLSEYTPKERLSHLPNDILQWVDNVVDSLKVIYDDDNKIFLEFNSIKCDYLDEVLYGLQLIITRLKMFLNHHRTLNLPLYTMEAKYVEGFMTAINNMCCIVILLCYGKRHFGNDDEYYTSTSESYLSDSLSSNCDNDSNSNSSIIASSSDMEDG